MPNMSGCLNPFLEREINTLCRPHSGKKENFPFSVVRCVNIKMSPILNLSEYYINGANLVFLYKLMCAHILSLCWPVAVLAYRS